MKSVINIVLSTIAAIATVAFMLWVITLAGNFHGF